MRSRWRIAISKPRASASQASSSHSEYRRATPRNGPASDTASRPARRSAATAELLVFGKVLVVPADRALDQLLHELGFPGAGTPGREGVGRSELGRRAASTCASQPPTSCSLLAASATAAVARVE